MPIQFHPTSGDFHLYNREISYILEILENGQLGHVYFGKRLTDREDFRYLTEYASRDMGACPFEGRRDFSLEHLKQEYPAFGAGDPRYPALEMEREDGSRVVGFRYREHRIFPGKKPLPGLPAVYVEAEEETETLEVMLEDPEIHTHIVLSYTIFRDYPVIARSARFGCGGPENITLLNAMSGCLDLPDADYEMVELAGAWARERHIHTRPLAPGIQGVYSLRGCSSHQFNPFLALKRRETTEFQGEALGFSLVYSGDFLAQAEVDNFGVTRVLLGIHPNEFRWQLAPGEEFQTPELVMAYSDHGLNGMSQTFHSLYRSRLARGFWRDRERPILINNWEATYFDFNEEKILEIAGKARDLGIELFVLDDGWFGKRNEANASLGDWYPNREKLPEGITGLAQKIEGLGMKFGLWIEPEMTNKDSDLFRAHPDWVLADIRRPYSHARNQYVLDFSREEVVEYIYRQLRKLLEEAPISYIKWDMNRSFSEAFSNGKGRTEQGKVRHQYILGVYRLYDRLTREFPEILFESCASGGARFDPGMLYYAPQGWTSDDTDAVERIKIQYGTSLVYPLSSMGSHVSAAPNHQVFRNTPLATRANVAYFGTFGYELDVTRMTEEEQEAVKRQVAFMKAHRRLIQFGTFYRLKSPFAGNSSAWMVVSPDGGQALFAYFRILQPAQGKLERICLAGLEEGARYQITEVTEDSAQELSAEAPASPAATPALSAETAQPPCAESFHYGDELMYAGFSVSDFSSGIGREAYERQGDYFSRLYYLEKLPGEK